MTVSRCSAPTKERKRKSYEERWKKHSSFITVLSKLPITCRRRQRKRKFVLSLRRNNLWMNATGRLDRWESHTRTLDSSDKVWISCVIECAFSLRMKTKTVKFVISWELFWFTIFLLLPTFPWIKRWFISFILAFLGAGKTTKFLFSTRIPSLPLQLQQEWNLVTCYLRK